MNQAVGFWHKEGLRGLLGIMLVAALLTGCFEAADPDDPGAAVSQVVPSKQGGTLAVETGGGPLRGLAVSILAGALTGDAETIQAQAEPALPGALPPEMRALGAVPAGPTVVLTRSGQGDFGAPVMLRLPLGGPLAADQDALVTVWEPATQRYVPLEVLAVDRNAGFVYAMTSHFSVFNAFLYRTPALRSVQTAFDPARHGFRHPNITTVFDDGDCYGIAAFAKWHWRYRREAGGGLYARFGGDDAGFFNDALAREVMARAQQMTLGENVRTTRALMHTPDGLAQLLRAHFPDAPALADELQQLDRFRGQRLIAQLQMDGPQLLLFGRPGVGSHAVLVHAFVASANGGGHFLAYDPNTPHPAPPLQLGWHPDTGWAPLAYTVNGAPQMMDRFWVGASDTWFQDATIAQIEQEALAGTLKRFEAFTINNLTLADGVTRACVVGNLLPAGESQPRCHLLTSAIGNGAGPFSAEGKAANIWNRDDQVSLLDGALLPELGRQPLQLPIDTAILNMGTSYRLEVAMVGANLSSQDLETNGRFSRYRAFAQTQLQVVPLRLELRSTAAGHEVVGLLGQQPLPPTAAVRWTLNGVPQSASGNVLSLTGAPTAGAVAQLQVLEGSDASLNPASELALASPYLTTVRVLDAQIGPQVDRPGANLYCTGGTPGELETWLEHWALASNGLAWWTTDGDSGQVVVQAAYDSSSGAIRAGQTDPYREVTPQGSTVRFYSQGQQVLTAQRSGDGVIRGTLVHTIVNSWALDGSTATCVTRYDYESRPTGS